MIFNKSSQSLLRVVEILGLVLLIVAGWSVRSGLSLTGLSDGDTWGFLMPALSFLAGDGIVDVQQREWIYSAFIGLALQVTGSFAGLISIQQAFGMLGGILLWLTWKSWVSLLPPDFIVRILAVAAGWLVLAVYFLNPHLIFFERSIRPEVLMVPVALAQLLCMVLFCKYRWATPSALRAVLSGTGAILFAFVVFKLKPSWALAIPVTVLPVFIGVLGRGLPLSARISAPALGVVAVLFFVWLPQKVIFVTDGQPRTILPLTLFTMNAESIRDSMVKRLEGGDLPPKRAALYEEILPVLDEELDTARTLLRHYPQVGFDPDYLLYQASIFPQLVHDHGLDKGDIAEFCNSTYTHAWIDEPIGMTTKILRQFTYFIFPDPLTFSRKQINLEELYAHSAKVLPDKPTGDMPPWVNKAYGSHKDTLTRESKSSAATIDSFRPLHKFLGAMTHFVFPFELVYLCALGAVFFIGSLRDFRLAGLVALLIFGAPAANAFTIAAVHALDNSRYRASYGPLLFLALMAMLMFSIAVLSAFVQRKKFGLRKQHPITSENSPLG